MGQKKGVIYFVGAGPGDPKLITVRGAELLQQADVIIYDRLVNPQLLSYAKKDVDLVYCGKTPDEPSISQEAINNLLVFHGLKGQTVVRLKGGDPAIFGRVGEEAAFCQRHHLKFEIVPGITSGIAAPIYAGIPLTHRDFSSSFAVITAHRRKNSETDDINWSSLAKGIDTLVFYMGIKQIDHIQQKLILHGRSPDTPVAIIRWGTCDNQETVTTTLTAMPDIVKSRRIQAPAIIVVGNVVKVREQLSWFENKLTSSELTEVMSY
ncbi:uroporphyrinogen-III C-methyltransferase [Salipaludibacillus agaradhaerens]|uniref:Uroporphyrinogen-III C-methyltransferase n=1 Tax=Salipaludibacillus agaradhaerens TaxID=76935 RepID=A0A9Q4B237_SALAG|nr:uroporphyrinogen-III C-methyltransferase [Salipaludibacillus agaradhaerens]MCR6096921.1 uroporphyrinogen-III C-methyltransferase [Salipaludibacillus agaradhaerens]MCR6113594.1 uroporphyrinogen-III C-methyltransferase [Salipaludibacillus agaradhaerens]